MTLTPKPPPGSLARKMMLSSALILGSGTYAWMQYKPGKEIATLQPVERQPAASPMKVAAQPQAAAPPAEQLPRDSAPPHLPMATKSAPRTQIVPPDAASVDEPSAAYDNATSTPPDALAPNVPSEPVPSPASPVQPSGRYVNGDFTGPSTDTPWGTVQVMAHVQNGAIAEVVPIDYPQHRRRSIEINEWALPILAREVIQAQSADVDVVSQATTTSVGYMQSLAGALAQAKR